MVGVLIPVGLLAGNTWRQALNVFCPFGQDAPLLGLLLHLGVSAVYGIVFGLVQPLIPQRLPGWLAGLGYGVLLFALAELVLLPPKPFWNVSTAPASALVGTRSLRTGARVSPSGIGRAGVQARHITVWF